LLQANDGNIYGATSQGTGSAGALFKITLDGTLTTLLTFNDGSTIGGGLMNMVQGTDGNLYGTALGGKAGVFFRLDLGLPPISSQPGDAFGNGYPGRRN
jgi:uncharacterized repeat protein (TIGR03803 family)